MIQNRVPVFIYHSLIELGCGQLLRISKIVVELHQSYRACVVLSNSLDKKHLFHYRRTGSRGEGSGGQIEGGEGLGRGVERGRGPETEGERGGGGGVRRTLSATLGLKRGTLACSGCLLTYTSTRWLNHHLVNCVSYLSAIRWTATIRGCLGLKRSLY